MRRSGNNVHVTGPNGQSIEVKFFDDGSVRFSLMKPDRWSLNMPFYLVMLKMSY